MTSAAAYSKTVYTTVSRIASTIGSQSTTHGHTAWAAAAMPKQTCVANVLLKTTYTRATVHPLFQKRFYAKAPAAIENESANVFTPPNMNDYTKPASVDETGNKNFAYFMVGSLSMLSAVAAKSMVSDYLVHFSASADVVAMAKVEVDMNAIPEGKNVILKWRGKPVFIRHRTSDEIEEANQVNISELRHQETDAQRTKKPEWLVMLGVCTHLGCVPIGEAGDYGGWFCPCHGSHYDISGRIRKGPAPLNLEIPEYDFTDDGKIVIG